MMTELQHLNIKIK